MPDRGMPISKLTRSQLIGSAAVTMIFPTLYCCVVLYFWEKVLPGKAWPAAIIAAVFAIAFVGLPLWHSTRCLLEIRRRANARPRPPARDGE